jgi:TolA-binding protein
MEDHPQADRIWYELAWVRRRMGEEKGALAAFRRLADLTRDPDLAGEARLHLAEEALAARPAAARQLLGQVQGKHRGQALGQVQGKHRGQALYRLAFSWLDAGEPDRALPPLQELLAAKPRHPLHREALFLVGECHFRKKEYEEAAPFFARLLALDPDHDRAQRARLHLGRCEVVRGRAAEAASLLEEFLRRGEKAPAGERARAHLWLGQARAAGGQLDRAEASFRRAVDAAAGPLAAEAQFRIGECRKERADLAGAVEAWLKLPILYGHAEWVQRGLMAAARAYEELRQSAKARKLYDELIRRYPDTPAAREAAARRGKGGL